ncbi:23S rRNA (adenine(2030)-N(6))-methyltransferase RlmJ [Saccharophagus degradans]|uniref:23S rRNA (adenine(2030)-N(6))-methyltransferase RlmJ n=1 Tax=Saccharophagus degradans TaxID=86304 RepID=UPI002477F902|nr:23S rRNA (adenine(2030)-N(6))-methyltransferase RlmJ [Saccharophagus degradans]WGO97545.1 23S rRNA (adenine(2030)-N(6))-methyltransferase RlmJ [Saccharophagus degradans]
MLSYLHGYHAGNFADVHKHCTLMLLLKKLHAKNTPITYIDTHAGAGLYALDDEKAEKTRESQLGVDALLASKTGVTHSAITEYLHLLASVRVSKQHTLGEHAYPGSPAIAQALLREQDFGILMELHNNEVGKLKQHFKRDTRLSIHHRDGFEGLAALTPPSTARGLALIDPSYELTSDYHQLISSLQTATARWRTGVFAVWYPILAGEKNHADFIKRKLAQLDVASVLNSELHIYTKEKNDGMIGSGMAIINAPWQLDTELESLLPELETLLAQSSKVKNKVEWLKEKA